MVADLVLEILAWLVTFAKNDEGNNTLPLDLVGTADDGRFGHGRMTDQGTFHLGRAEAMTGNIEDIVDTADDPEIPLLVAAGAIAGEVGTLHLAPVLLAVPCLVAPDAAKHRGPGLADHKLPTLTVGNFPSLVIDDRRINPEEGERRGSGLAGGGTGKGRDHVGPGLGLPPGIDDGAALVADVLVEPHPGLGVDGLPDGSEQAERGEVVLLKVLVAPLHEGSDGRRGRIEDGDAVVGDELPEAVGLGPVGSTLVHETGRPVAEGSVDEVTVACDPADVGGAPVDIILPEIEDILGGGVSADQVTARGVENSLGLSGGSAGVEDKERMLAVEMLGRAVGGDILHLPVPPDIAPFLDVDVDVRAPEDDDLLDGSVPLQGVIDILLEGNELTAAVATVGRDDHLGPAVGKPVLDALGAEAAEDHAVNRADAGAGQHGDRGLGNEGHVEKDTVPLLHAVALEDICEFADLAVELAVSQNLFVTRFPLPDDRGLVRTRPLQMAIEAVLGGIHLGSDKPLGIGELPIKHLGPFFEPMEFLGLAPPEFVGLGHRLGMEFFVNRHAADAGFLGELSRGLEDTVLDEMGLNVLRHGG